MHILITGSLKTTQDGTSTAVTVTVDPAQIHSDLQRFYCHPTDIPLQNSSFFFY